MTTPSFPARPDADQAEAVAHGERVRAHLEARVTELEGSMVRLWGFTRAHTACTDGEITVATGVACPMPGGAS